MSTAIHYLTRASWDGRWWWSMACGRRHHEGLAGTTETADVTCLRCRTTRRWRNRRKEHHGA